MKKRAICVILAVMLLLSIFSGCGQYRLVKVTEPTDAPLITTPELFSPEYTAPTFTVPEFTMPEISVPELVSPDFLNPEEQSIDYAGSIVDGSYQNPYFQFGFTPESGWSFFSEEQLLETNDLVGETMEEIGGKNLFNRKIEDGGTISVMMANNLYSENINIIVQSTPPAWKVLGQDMILNTLKNMLENQYRELGFTDASLEISSVTFMGKTEKALSVTLGVGSMAQKQYCLMQDDYTCIITVSALSEYNVDQVFSWFHDYDATSAEIEELPEEEAPHTTSFESCVKDGEFVVDYKEFEKRACDYLALNTNYEMLCNTTENDTVSYSIVDADTQYPQWIDIMVQFDPETELVKQVLISALPGFGEETVSNFFEVAYMFCNIVDNTLSTDTARRQLDMAPEEEGTLGKEKKFIYNHLLYVYIESSAILSLGIL